MGAPSKTINKHACDNGIKQYRINVGRMSSNPEFCVDFDFAIYLVQHLTWEAVFERQSYTIVLP